MTLAPPADASAPPRRHPRVQCGFNDGVATVVVRPPRNPLRVGAVMQLLWAAVMMFLGSAVAALVLGRRGFGEFFLAMVACGVAWLVAEMPSLIPGLHTRVELAIDADELRAVVRYLWASRAAAYRRDRVIGVRVVAVGGPARALHVRFADAEPLEIMAGYPIDQIEAAAEALKHALARVAPATPVLRADDVATLPYAGGGRRYEVEVLRLADGVSVTVPPPLHAANSSLGGVIFALMWLVMFALLYRATACLIAALFVLGGTWAFAVAVRQYLRRGRPLVMVLMTRQLVIENGPWFRPNRRIPREQIESIAHAASGRERRYVLVIKLKNRRRPIELMVDREPDEIQRVADAFNDAG